MSLLCHIFSFRFTIGLNTFIVLRLEFFCIAFEAHQYRVFFCLAPHGSTQTNSHINITKRGWDKSPSLSIVFGLSSKTQWLSGLYYADFISFYSPTQLCGGGTTKSNSNELPISVPLSLEFYLILNVLPFRISVS